MTQGEFKKLLDELGREAIIKPGHELGRLELMRLKIDEAQKDFPITAYDMEKVETALTRETVHLEFDMPTPKEFIELLKWFLKYFGRQPKKSAKEVK